jgi:hypothetical protein
MNASKRWSKGDDKFLRDHAQKQKLGRIAAQAPVVGARSRSLSGACGSVSVMIPNLGNYALDLAYRGDNTIHVA